MGESQGMPRKEEKKKGGGGGKARAPYVLYYYITYIFYINIGGSANEKKNSVFLPQSENGATPHNLLKCFFSVLSIIVYWGVSCNQKKKKENMIDGVVEDAVRSMMGNMNYRHQHEIEARLGRMEGGHFISGVNPEWFNVIRHRLELCNSWSDQQGWQDSEDTTFEWRGKQVRQSRVCNTKDCRIDIRSIHKDRKASVCVPLQASRGDSCEDPFHLVPTGVDTMRVSYSTETPVAKKSFPDIVRPIYVRIKQRRSFILESSAMEGAAWRFDLTRTWAGRTREEAEQQQHESPAVCEVELEWIPPVTPVALPPVALLVYSLSQSILTKMASLL